MNKHYTKTFDSMKTNVGELIDAWIASFEIKQTSVSEGNAAEVVGYVSTGRWIVITLRRWEIQEWQK